MRRTLLAATAAGLLGFPAVAGAHVSVHPNVLPASSNPTLDVRVPNEETSAKTVTVDMQVPPGFLDVAVELPPGWRAQKLMRKLATPARTDSGTVTEEVSEIIWTAPRGGGIPPGSFVEFPITTAIPDGDAGLTLTFKVLQTYSNGDVVRWIDPSLAADHPAPTVDVTPKGGLIEDFAGREAGPGPLPASLAPAAATPAASKGASKGLGIAALVLGALALLVAIAGVARGRRA
jgi:uncharacterized protein YcnI